MMASFAYPLLVSLSLFVLTASSVKMEVKTCNDLYSAIQLNNNGVPTPITMHGGNRIDLSACSPSIPAIQSNIQITGVAKGGLLPALDGASTLQVLTFKTSNNANIFVSISNVLIENGAAPQNSNYGGCFSVQGTSVNFNLTNVLFKNCKAGYGGAIYTQGGMITLSKCHFDSCAASSPNGDNLGGAIYAYGGSPLSNSLAVKGSFFNKNIAMPVSGSASAARGGAIYTNFPTTIKSSQFIQNSAVSSSSNSALGGAIYQNDQSITISSTSKFQKNSATSAQGQAYGGAIYANRVTVSNTKFLQNSVFTSNYHTHGGAIYCDTFLSLSNSQFTNNRAATDGQNYNAYGGAVSYANYQNTLVNVAYTVFLNNTILGASAYGGALYTGTPLNLTWSKFQTNKATALLTVNSGNAGTAQGGAVYSSTSSSSNTHIIKKCEFKFNKAWGSIYVQGGALYVATNLFVSLTLFQLNHALADIGAYSSPSASVAMGGALYNNGYSIAITIETSKFTGNNAKSNPGDANGGALSVVSWISISNSIFETNYAQAACVVGCNPLVSGGGAVYSSYGVSITSTSFTKNYHSSFGTTPYSNGGAIFAQTQSSTTTMSCSKCTFTRNNADSLGQAHGGAVYFRMNSGLVTFPKCTFTSNFARGATEAYGGAIASGYGGANITSTHFKNNSAVSSGGDASGGAIDLRWSAYVASSVVSSSFFNNNSAVSMQQSARGGAIIVGSLSNSALPTTISKSTFSGNTLSAVQQASGGSIFVGIGNSFLSAAIASCKFDGSKVTAPTPSGGAVFVLNGAIATFCGSSIFGALEQNKRRLVDGSSEWINSDIDASGALVKFCPQVSINVDPSTTFFPVLSCDQCTCDPYLNPCAKTASCARVVLPGGTPATSCTCPTGVNGNGFICGKNPICSI